ncbi:MAG: DUF72 domain-containing protein [Actinomycetota bacterium]|nr:DUF72 domain-containing protein [Actinomycetota bacterium]
MAEVRIGTSGWLYAGWRGSFYPPGLPHRAELEYNASTFTSVEVNGSFYSLQRPESYQRWRETTPDDFVFAIKGGRFITHLKKLSDVETPLANFYASGVLALAHKLGPFLWQLPPSLGYDADRLERFFDLLPRSTSAAVELATRHDDKVAPDRTCLTTDAERPLRHALEVRHASFASDPVIELLRRHDIALVVADTAGKWPLMETPTTGFMYVRLHGADELYVSGYTDDALDRWADKVRAWLDVGLDVFVFFDNDAKVHAPYDAQSLMRRLGVGREQR